MSGDRIELLARINKLEQENEELREREIPKKPILEYGVDGYYYRCLECGKLILDDVTANSVSGDGLKEDCSYCSRCGAKVDWSDEE